MFPALLGKNNKHVEGPRAGEALWSERARLEAGGAVDALRWNQLRWALTLSPYGSFDLYDSTFDEMPSACVVTLLRKNAV